MSIGLRHRLTFARLAHRDGLAVQPQPISRKVRLAALNLIFIGFEYIDEPWSNRKVGCCLEIENVQLGGLVHRLRLDNSQRFLLDCCTMGSSGGLRKPIIPARQEDDFS
jgi:hypothetical protein